MRVNCILFACLMPAFWSGILLHANTAPLPENGRDLLAAPDPSAWRVYGKGVTARAVSVKHEAFDSALSVHTLRKPQHHYNHQLILPTIDRMEKGDTVLVSFWARATRTTDESGVGRMSVYLQKAKRPWNKSLFRQVTLGDQWVHYTLPGTSDGTYAPGEASLGIGFGFLPQTVEISGLRVQNFEKTLKPEALPETAARVTYAGQAPDAPWRSKAAQRIEKHRKAEVNITVIDAQGRPVPDAKIHLSMKRHAYAFGSAVVAKQLAGTSPVDRQYQDIVAEHYNRVVFENDLKFGPWRAGKHPEAHPTARFYHPNLLKAMEWLRERGIGIRGHTLLWGPVQEKRYYRGLTFSKDREEARRTLETHLVEVLEETRDHVQEWDVLNHPVARFGDNGNRLDKVFGPEFYADIIRLTRKTNPDLRLFVNEGSVMPRGAYRDDYEAHIASLVEAGAKPDGIGFMCHFDETSLTSMDELYKQLERYGKFGLPLLATELDITTKDEQGQADYLRDFMTLWFSHPQTEGIIMWGFWEGRHWRPDAALYRKDFSPKPAAETWVDLVKHQWWTDETMTSDAEGQVQTRGFLGEYEVTIRLPESGKPDVVRPIRLDSEGVTLKIQIQEPPSDPEKE